MGPANSQPETVLPEALRVEDVWKRFGSTQALRGVSLTLGAQRIHGLVGRNGAGKSTLVSTIVGDLKPDRGRVVVPGQGDDVDLRDHVAAVYQQMKLIPHLSVAENLQLGVYDRTWIRWRELRAQAREVLEEWNLPVMLDTPVNRLRLDQQQLLTVARALMSGARIVLLDEPTSRLNWRETEELFGQVRRLASQGITFLFISHSLREVFELCDDLTILRDGEVVATGTADAFTEADLIEKMSAGNRDAVDAAEPSQAPERRPAGAGRTLLDVRQLTVGRTVRGADLKLEDGEWIGLTGLVGSGALALAAAIAGYRRYDSGTIELDGERLPPGRGDRAIEQGIGFVPPDRHGNGLIPTLPVGRNLTLLSLRALSRLGFVNEAAERRMALQQVDRLGIVTGSIETPITSLSGGNQQKVLLGRAFASDPRVLVLANATVGVDIGSKAVIYDWMRRARREGMSGIVATEDELSDLEICDRVVVFAFGQVVAVLGRDRSTGDVLSAIEGFSVTSTGEERESIEQGRSS